MLFLDAAKLQFLSKHCKHSLPDWVRYRSREFTRMVAQVEANDKETKRLLKDRTLAGPFVIRDEGAGFDGLSIVAGQFKQCSSIS